MAWSWRTARSRRAVIVAVGLVLTLVSCNDDGGGVRSSPASSASPTAATGATADEGGDGASPSTTGPAGTMPAGDDAVVDHIVDGDTLRTTDDVRVRLLNIDAPEVDGNECWSAEATAFLESMVPSGTEIRLVYDVDRYDRYGRTLAHIYRSADGLWVNLAMVEAGAALPYVLQPNDAQYAPIDAAASDAESSGQGLWGACDRSSLRATTTGAPSASTAAPGPGTAAGTDRSGCDPSYPTVCIPPPPPDLDCADIVERRFTVLPPDPHHFDGGGDGIGCERD